jgi:hypothetical protein
MDFYYAVQTTNNLLRQQQPQSFNSSWIRQFAPQVYRFIQKNIRSEIGGIDWDRFTRALELKFQRQNMLAKQKIIKLVSFTINEWIENYPQISRWEGYHTLIQENIEGCIRRYRYSGSFMGYLFRTLEYAGRGLTPLIAYSLEDSLYSGEQRRIDKIGQDPETGEILIYS